jgi:ribosomal protein S18 acetylase RimI-like enzyme
MEQIKIIEYHPDLAAAVADMWNKSRDGWGGGNSVTTEEQVRQQEANSDKINLYLATIGDEVVGYCGLSEYREDEGSLYIPLLNVRGDYQGKKIGKLLLLKAVERCIELGWPRLDLYTWPGNTKAVPLYKKCGFFWEERDDSTHLMNFIPTVLGTEAVQDFFQEADWYQDAVKAIEVKPDGRKENKFDYYEYVWEKNNRKLRMEFERRGRGLRLIETDDYLISATVDNLDLVFGKEYNIRYDILNKSGKLLEISFAGHGDKNISYAFEKQVNIQDEARIEGSFYVNEIEEEQNVWRTHPTVTTTLEINGKKALFKVGIVPKFPANVSAKVPSDECFTEVAGQFYLDVENNFNEEAEFHFQLPQASFITFDQELYHVLLKSQEKRSIPIVYTLWDFGFYGVNLDIDAKFDNGEQVSFKKRIGVAFKGIGAKFPGESDDHWHIYNGHYHVLLSKFNNSILPGKAYLEGHPTHIMSPKLGKPYSSEFSKKRPEVVECFEEKGAMVLKATYQSHSFSHLQLISFVKLFAEGMIEHVYEVNNVGDTETDSDIWLNHPLYHDLYRSVLPYDQQVIELKDSNGDDYEDWDGSKITENWVFAKGRKIPIGISWSPKYKIHFEGWYLFFECNLGKISAKKSMRTGPTFISIGAYQDWEDFRAFALRSTHSTSTSLTNHVELKVNEGNPFVKDQCTVMLTDYKSAYFDGELQIKLLNETNPQIAKSFSPENKVKATKLDLNVSESRAVDIVQLQAQFTTQQLSLRSLVLRSSDTDVQMLTKEKEGLTIFSADNGVIQIKAAPKFFPSLCSLTYKGEEWLDSSFPCPKPKSWWNPWGGGMGSSLRGVSENSILKEKRNAEFASIRDSHQNEWKGIKINVQLEEHSKYKGLEWNQYFLLIPGLPVLCQTTEIIQKTGSFLQLAEWHADSFLKLDSKNEDSWMKTHNRQGEALSYRIGNGAIDMKADSSFICGSDHRQNLLQVTTDLRSSKLHFYSNKEITNIINWRKLNLQDGENFFTSPVFYMLIDQMIPEDALGDLKKIRF